MGRRTSQALRHLKAAAAAIFTVVGAGILLLYVGYGMTQLVKAIDSDPDLMEMLYILESFE